MKKLKNNIYILLILLGTVSFAQQLPQFSQYMFNTISVNPAYAGSRETISLVGLHRSQWVGLEGGPSTQTLSVHSPLKQENIGYENFVFAYADFSYTIQTSENRKLAFGLKGGFTHYNLDREGFLTDQSVSGDPYFSNFTNRWNPNIGVGLYWHSDLWYLGLSAPRILKTDFNESALDPTVDYQALERVSYYFTGGYVFTLTDNTKLKPAVLIKATNGAPLSIDANANFLLNEKLWLGGGYRYNRDTSTIGAMADFQISNQLRIGYAYEHFITDLRPYTSGTHEILLMFEVFKPSKRIKSPRYF